MAFFPDGCENYYGGSCIKFTGTVGVEEMLGLELHVIFETSISSCADPDSFLGSSNEDDQTRKTFMNIFINYRLIKLMKGMFRIVGLKYTRTPC